MKRTNRCVKKDGDGQVLEGWREATYVCVCEVIHTGGSVVVLYTSSTLKSAT